METNYISEDIRWMQISDLHIGNNEYRWTDRTLKDRFRYLFQEGIIPHLQFIILTGDIIDRGEINNREYVEELYDFLDIIQSFAETIIVTPGNHDYVRNEPRYALLKNWRLDQKRKRNEISYANKLAEDFSEFCKLFEGYSKGGKNQNIYVSNHSRIITLEGINIVTLNTSTFSGQPRLDHRGNIVLKNRVEQIDDDGKLWICEKDLPELSELNLSNPTIMIGHHPFEMFDDFSVERLIRFAAEAKIHHYFCGHMHQMNTIVNNYLAQHTSAGLFRDSYNIPSFVVYSIKRSANETIKEKVFYWDLDWKSYDGGNIPQSDIDNSHEIIGKDTSFIIPPSVISDGAVRIPYGKGKFNLYISKDESSSIVIPHKHDDLDEIVYVIKGALFIVIDDTPCFVRAGNAQIMPKGRYHGLIPAQFPYEFLTMSFEQNYCSSFDWQDNINKIRQIDKNLLNGEYGLEKYNDVIDYLSSPIMEVRWEAENVLNKRLVKENDKDNVYIREVIGTKIRPALRSVDIQDQFFGLSIAYELGIDVSDQEIIDLLKSDHYMVTWVCAYYVIKRKKDLDLQKLFYELSENQVLQRTILAILQLLVAHDGKLLRENYHELEERCLRHGSLSIADILIYFTIWYTSFTYMDQELDYSKASILFQEIFNNEGDQILRGFTNIKDSADRYQQVVKCKEYGKLVESVCAYFESICVVRGNNYMTEEKTKERIENYLRIIVSEKCNLKCVYCHHEGRIDSLIGASVNQNINFNLRELLKKAKALNFKKIKISGGEPLLYPDILLICNEFQKDFEDIGFTTNGTQICNLKKDIDNIRGSRLSFNVSLNSLDEKKNEAITGFNSLQDTISGIVYLIENSFTVKLNSVITSYNIDEITSLISFAARQRIDIKLLDLFEVEGTPEEFKHVSIAEIKREIMKEFRLKDSDFIRQDDYLIAQVMGIKVMIPSRIYSIDCQYNCKMYPCAEGIFGIRVYEDYSCAKCFSGTIYQGNLSALPSNIRQIRKELNSMRFSY